MNDPRLIDSHKLMFHPHRVAQWHDAGGNWDRAKKVYPLYVEVSPMGACNHRCTFCAVDYIGYKARQLDPDILCERLAEMARHGVKSVMFAGEGEPLLYKHINRAVDISNLWGIDVSFTTNGVLLDKLNLEHVAWVKVSLNAGTRDTYAKVHRTKPEDWDRVWENLREAKSRKGDCEIGVQMVVLPENQHEVQEIQQLCEEAGVDYLVLKPYSQHKMSLTRMYENFQPELPRSVGAKTVVRWEAFGTKEIGYDKCNATPFMWAYIMASGDVYSCSAYLMDERFLLGNINDSMFREVWEGERRRANWELMKGHDISQCRLNCRMDKANRYLADFGRVRNVSFI